MIACSFTLNAAGAAILAVLSTVGRVEAQSQPADFFVPECSLSPDHQYGVLVGDRDQDILQRVQDLRNRLVAMPAQRVILTMKSEGWSRRSYPGGLDPNPYRGSFFQPRWSEDSSLLLWKVAGKWMPDSLELVKLAHHKIVWRLDLLQTAQQAILARTRKARPRKYLAIKKDHLGDSSAYPDGFTVTVYTEGEKGKSVSLPLIVHADLTSDPKEDRPTNLVSQLDGVVRKDGVFIVTRFQLAPRQNEDF